MPRESQPASVVKIRTTFTRHGQPYCMISLPSSAMDVLGWKPGMYLAYYPTEGRELVLVLRGQMLRHVSPDYDLSVEPRGEEMPTPRKGSLHERKSRLDEEYEQHIRDLEGGEEDMAKRREKFRLGLEELGVDLDDPEMDLPTSEYLHRKRVKENAKQEFEERYGKRKQRDKTRSEAKSGKRTGRR